MGNCAAANGRSELAGSVFDRVTSRTSSEDDCLLYRLCNYQRGGDLVDYFVSEGSKETEILIKEQIPLLLYRRGEGQTVTRTDYLKWKYRNKSMTVLPMDEPTPQWKDHEACWNLEFRGSLGETLLHMLIICDSKVHTRIAKLLLKCFPKLALDIVEGEEFRGASALHLAIAYNNLELVKQLVDAGAIIDQRATGTFFLPRDQQRPKPAKHTDYEGLAYFGELPLAWAACCGNEAVYNLLVDHGANPNSQDAFGNMVLHMVVVCDKLEMYGYALRHPRFPAKMGIANSAGLTPLTMACRLGRATIFREMLELTALEFWRYSNITCSAYPLNALDTILPDGRSNWNSALMIILNGTKEEHLDMLDGGIIQRLLEEKWKTFARVQFLKRLAILFFHLFALSVAVYLRPTSAYPLIPEWHNATPIDIARLCFESVTVGSCLIYVIIQQGSEIRNQGLWGFIKQLAHNPAKTIFLISNLLTLACIPCRLMQNRNAEEAILIFAVPGAWFFLMFFAGAVRLTGPFVTMIYSMITGDMLTFSIIYLVMLLAFTQAFYFIHKGHPHEPVLFQTYPSTWMALFQWTLGEYNYTALGETHYPALANSVFVIFMVLVPILLLNMLIAMMGNTYALVIQQSEKEWVKQWAKIVLALERSVSQNSAKEHLLSYSIKLGGGGDGGDGGGPAQEMRGVMVIKSKNKTRAKQRKGALNNWKRVGRVTIAELRRRGIRGDTLRRQIWDPRSGASTPGNVSPIPGQQAGCVSLDLASTALAAFGQVTEEQDPVKNVGDTLSHLALQSKLSLSFPEAAKLESGYVNKASNCGAFDDVLSQLVTCRDTSAAAAEDPAEFSTTAPVAASPPSFQLPDSVQVTRNGKSSPVLSDIENEIIARTLLDVHSQSDLANLEPENNNGTGKKNKCPTRPGTAEPKQLSIIKLLEQRRGSCPVFLDEFEKVKLDRNLYRSGSCGRRKSHSSHYNRYIRPRIVIDFEHNRDISESSQSLTVDDNLLGAAGFQKSCLLESPRRENSAGLRHRVFIKRTNVVKPLAASPILTGHNTSTDSRSDSTDSEILDRHSKHIPMPRKTVALVEMSASSSSDSERVFHISGATPAYTQQNNLSSKPTSAKKTNKKSPIIRKKDKKSKNKLEKTRPLSSTVEKIHNVKKHQFNANPSVSSMASLMAWPDSTSNLDLE